MRIFGVAIGLAALLSGCASTADGAGRGGSASLSLRGSPYRVGDVVMMLEMGDDGWVRTDGDALPRTREDCVPGLAAGISLYGDLPSSVSTPTDLVGKRLRVDFSGDGDDANFCFSGMGGLAGAESAWVTFDAVTGNRVSFTIEGSFRIYDENGDGPVADVSGKGTAVAQLPS